MRLFLLTLLLPLLAGAAPTAAPGGTAPSREALRLTVEHMRTLAKAMEKDLDDTTFELTSAQAELKKVQRSQTDTIGSPVPGTTYPRTRPGGIHAS